MVALHFYSRPLSILQLNYRDVVICAGRLRMPGDLGCRPIRLHERATVARGSSSSKVEAGCESCPKEKSNIPIQNALIAMQLIVREWSGGSGLQWRYLRGYRCPFGRGGVRVVRMVVFTRADHWGGW